MSFLTKIVQDKETGKYSSIAESVVWEGSHTLCTCAHDTQEEARDCPISRQNMFPLLKAYHKEMEHLKKHTEHVFDGATYKLLCEAVQLGLKSSLLEGKHNYLKRISDMLGLPSDEIG